MTIEKRLEGSKLVLEPEGRLDTTTASDLEREIVSMTGDVTSLVLDFAGLEYVSSAGLRVILLAQKRMQSRSGMIVKNVNDSIMEVFEMTGFDDILTIQ